MPREPACMQDRMDVVAMTALLVGIYEDEGKLCPGGVS
jgi:hypothetical protein